MARQNTIRIVHTQQVNDSDLFSFGKIIKKNFYFLPTNPTPELLYIVKGAKNPTNTHHGGKKGEKEIFIGQFISNYCLNNVYGVVCVRKYR